MFKYIDGGVTAALGFKASGIHVGVKTNNTQKKDVALIVSEVECNAAAVYTKNLVKAAPLYVTKEHLKNGKAQAVIVNSGNANACVPEGEQNALKMCELAASALNINTNDVVVASTGVIGQSLTNAVKKIENKMPELTAQLSADGSNSAAAAIMTTDTKKKECAVSFEIGGKTVKIGAIAKGSGMIHPNMGTMLCFITTDCAITSAMLDTALKQSAGESFNRVSIDGDTSTNDMAVVLANGLAKNIEITEQNADYEVFYTALREVCVTLARDMAADGEGAKHLITCTVSGAESEAKAEIIAKSVITSTLFKAMIFGADANCGRVLCAIGYSGAEFNPEAVSVVFKSAAGEITVCENGQALVFDEVTAKKILTEHEVEVLININEGNAECTCWGCDITYDYIKINGDYRT